MRQVSTLGEIASDKPLKVSVDGMDIVLVRDGAGIRQLPFGRLGPGPREMGGEDAANGGLAHPVVPGHLRRAAPPGQHLVHDRRLLLA
jgi:hypothetical protein